MKCKFVKFISLFLSVLTAFSFVVTAYSLDAHIDNSYLLKYEGDNAKISKSYCDGAIETPEWVDSLIIVEVRPDTASIGGSLPECYDLLDFYAEVGVNGIWLAPIYERTQNGNGYSNCGPHTLEPAITGTNDTEKGWQVVKEFVDYAHSKGIYIFLDVITWGVVRGAPLIEEHPDWFNGEAWGNIAFDWSNEELYNWYVDTLVNNILVTGADGYRCDCEPFHSGYSMFGQVRQKLKEKGKNIVVISEDYSTRSGTYDFEQDGVMKFDTHSRGDVYQNPVNFFADGYLNIVDTVKNGTDEGYPDWQGTRKAGTAKYYTNCITNHDYQRRDVCGNRISIGYSAIFAPYIPIWYMGDEFNASNNPGVLYDLPVDFSEMNNEENAQFLNDVKKMINIRRTYSDIFEYWAMNHKNSNICKVETDNFGTLQSYARYKGNKAVLIVANNTDSAAKGNIKIPFSDCGINFYKSYKVTDLMTGEIIIEGTKKQVETFTAEINSQYVGAYLVEGEEPVSKILINLSSFFMLLPDKIYSLICNFVSI